MSNDFVKNSYNKIAEDYLKQRDQFKNNKYLDRLSKLLHQGSTILDVGCGAGIPVDAYLVKKGYVVKGIDISERQISLARKFVPEGTFEVKDMSKLKNNEYKVDAVISFYAIFHTPRESHGHILKTFRSFIIDKGYLLITMGVHDWIGKEDDFAGGEMWWSHYNADKNKDLVKEAGFEILLNEIDTSANEEHLIILAQKTH